MDSNDFGIDLNEVRQLIDTADVFMIRFAHVELRLLVDTRTNEVDGPMVKLVSRAQSMEERVASIQKLRPRFPMPEKLMSFWWPRHVAGLEASGLWQHLTDRLASVGGQRAEEESWRAYHDLLREERREVMRAIRGEGYQSLWEVRA